MASNLVEWVLRVKDETSGPMDAASESAHGMAESVDEVSESTATAEQQAGKAKEVLEGFAGAVDKISPAAGAAVRNIGAMVGGIKSAAAVSGSLLAVLGPVTVAIGAAGAAYMILNRHIEQANRTMADAKTASDNMAAAAERAAAAEIKAAVATGKMTEAQAASMAAVLEARDAFGGLAEAAERQERYARSIRLILGNEGDRADAQRGFKQIREQMEATGDTANETYQLVDKLAGTWYTLTSGTKAATEAMAKAESLERNAIKRQEMLATAIERTAKNIETGAKAGGTKDLVASIESVKAAETEGVDTIASAWSEFSALHQSVTDDMLSEQAKILRQAQEYHLQILDVAEALDGVAGAEEHIAELQAEATAWTERQLEALEKQRDVTSDIADNQERSAMAAAQQAVGGAQAGMGGPAGVASMFGPIGALIGAVLDLLQQLGDGGLEDKLEGVNTSIIEGIKALPEFLGEAGPELVSDFTEALIVALAENADDLAVKLTGGFIEAMSFLAGRLPSILFSAIVEAIRSAWEAIKSGDAFTGGAGRRGALGLATGGISELFMGGRDRGSMSIDSTGLYVVHQGEQIVQRGGRATQTAEAVSGGPGGSGGVSVTVHASGVMSPQFGDVLADFIREQQARGLVFG